MCPGGVRKSKNRYEARIKVNGEDIFIGSFLTLEEAEQARINYEHRCKVVCILHLGPVRKEIFCDLV